MQISGGMMSVGIQTIQASQQQLAEAAQAVASSVGGSGSELNIEALTKQLMQMEQAKQMSEAGAKMVESADEALGTIINTLA